MSVAEQTNKENLDNTNPGMKRNLAYGIGCFGTDIYWQSVSFFLLFYYTDVLEIPNTIAGLIFMLATFWDAITDPIMGMIAARTAGRLGGYRKWLLFGAIPLGISFVLMFAQPYIIDQGTGLVVLTVLAHVLFRTAYTAVSIPYGALAARITSDSDMRGRLASYRVIFGLLAGLVVALTMRSLVTAIGGEDEKFGFLVVNAIFAVIGTAAIMVTYLGVQEKTDVEAEVMPSYPDMLKMILANKPLQVVVSGIIILSVSSVLLTKTVLYYFEHYIGDESLGDTALAIILLPLLLLTPFWAWFSRRTSKRMTWIVGSLISAAVSFAFFAYAGRDPGVTLIFFALSACGSAALPVTFWSMIPDTVEVGEFKTGVRAEGAIYGSITLSQKIGLAFGGGIIGILLDVIGYTANQAQTEATKAGLHTLITLAPAIMTVVGVVIISRYTLDANLHRRLRVAIAWKKSRKAH